MHTVDLLERALEAARQLGYEVRHEYMGGVGGGGCEFGGKKWLFVDLALNSVEQLDQVTKTLQVDPGIHFLSLPAELRRMCGISKRAA